MFVGKHGGGKTIGEKSAMRTPSPKKARGIGSHQILSSGGKSREEGEDGKDCEDAR